MVTTRLVAVTTFLFGILNSLPAVSNCEPYRHLNMPDRLEEDAVIKIESGTEYGTAFLIDRRRGIFLTARHVVLASIDANQSVVGSLQIAESELSLSVVAHDEFLDVALLKLDESDRSVLLWMMELELSFDSVEEGEVAILSMADSDMDGPSVTRRVESGFKIQDSRIRIPTLTEDGTSGAPIVREDSGMVIGIVVRKRSVYFAIGVGTVPMIDFIVEHTVDELPTRLAHLVEESDVRTSEMFHDVFRTFLPNPFTNIELARMIDFMESEWQRDSEFRIPSTVGTCKQLVAGQRRSLGSFSGTLHVMANYSSSAGADGVARAVLEEVEQRGDGSQENTATLFGTASNLLVEPVKFALSSEMSRMWADRGVDADVLSAASVVFAPYTAVGSFGAQGDWQLPTKAEENLALFQDATWRARSLGWVAFEPWVDNNIVAAAALRTQLVDGEVARVRSFEALGDVLRHSGRFGDAAVAFGRGLRIDPENNGLLDKQLSAVWQYQSSTGDPARLGMSDDLWGESAVETEWVEELIRSLRSEGGLR